MTITEASPSTAGSHRGPANLRTGGTTPSPLELLELVRAYSEEMRDLLPGAGPELRERSYELLELTNDIEIWAIHWPKDRGLELHDHGGSSGALWVIDGTLSEHSVSSGGALSSRSIDVGAGTAFGPGYIHDVVNTDDVVATSVHIYSPPMASMTFYRQQGASLVVERAEYRADPSWAP